MMKQPRTILMLCTLALGMFAPGAMAEPSGTTRVLLVGDSVMRVPAHAVELQLRRREHVESHAFTSLGSGLARLDVFDWMTKIDELVADISPDISVAWFGANDYQPLRVEGEILQPGSEAWVTEYSRRIGDVMDKLTVKPGSRVFWLELPDMRDASVQRHAGEINKILKQEADARERVVFVETRAVLSRRQGTFTMHVSGPTGMPVQVRDPDGIHLNRAGADRIAEMLVRELFPNGGGR